MSTNGVIVAGVTLALALGCATSNTKRSQEARDLGPVSRVETGAPGELILVQELIIKASLERTWSAYTTTEGWLAWVAPVAEVELRAGGRIRTHYTEDATLGQPGTIELEVVNFVPQRLLTLKVVGSDSFPIFMRSDAQHLFTVVTFEELEPTRTRVTSYGVGYRDTSEYRKVLEFFITANEKLLLKLRSYLEKTPTAG